MEHFELDKNCVRFEEESALSIYDFPNAYGRYTVFINRKFERNQEFRGGKSKNRLQTWGLITIGLP